MKDIYDHCKEGVSLFEPYFFKESLFNYQRIIKHVFSNVWLDERYFPSFEKIESIEQVDSLRDGILYLSDIERLFNSRGSLTDKQMNELIDIVDNAGKHQIQVRGSSHRSMSVDVKIRTIVNLWVEPEPYPVGDYGKLENYVVCLRVYDGEMHKLGRFAVDELNRYANLYNTNEESRRLGVVPLGGRPNVARPPYNPYYKRRSYG
jgi:hypothetical protein